MSFIWDKNTGKIGPARVKASLLPSYTLDELCDLANRYGDVAEPADVDDPDLVLRLSLSGFLTWLKKREQEVEG